MQEAERGQLAPGGRHEPLLERDQAQVPQHPVRGRWRRLNVRGGGEPFARLQNGRSLSNRMK